MDVVISLLGIIAGLLLLIKSTEIFLDEAIDVFTYHGFSPFVIGVLVVGFGTSLPELGIAIASAIDNQTLLALSSAVGSNIANIACVLAVSLITFKGEMPSFCKHASSSFLLVIASCMLMGLAIYDYRLSRLDAALLFVFFAWFLYQQIKNKSVAQEVTTPKKKPKAITRKDYAWLIGSMLVVIASARIVALSAIKTAAALGIAETFIGLTIIAFGSSLPELVSSYFATKKGEFSIVIGNIIGSNIMNTLLVVGTAVMVSPLLKEIPENLVNIEIPIALVLAIGLWLGIRLEIWTRYKIRIISAVILIASYCAWIMSLISNA